MDSVNLKKASAKLNPGRKPNASKTIRAAVELAANHEPELFLVNRPAIRQIDKNIEAGRDKLQTVINEFKAVTGKVLTMVELQTFVEGSRRRYLAPKFETIRELVITKLIEGKGGEVAGIQLSEAKLRELVILPDLTNLMAAVEDVVNVPEVNYQEIFYWHCYHVAEGKVTIIPEQVEQVKNQYRCFAMTSQERTKLSRVKGLCNSLNTFIEDTDLTPSPSRLDVKGVCYYDPESRRFEPSEQYIKFGLR